MEQTNVKKIKKIGNFYVTKINMKNKIIKGIYFDKKFERLVKIRDRQAYFWFVIFAILEGLFRPYIFEIVVGLAIAVVLSNLLFHIFLVRPEVKSEISLPEQEFFSVVDKKHRAWRQTFTMALVFVCMARLLIFVQPGQFSDFEVTSVYCISLALSFFTIIVWLYYGGMKNQLKQQQQRVVKKKRAGKNKNLKYIQ